MSVLIVLVVIAIAACVWDLMMHWDRLPIIWDWLRTTSDGVESNSATIRNIGLVIAGLIALPLAIWRSMVAQEQANTAQQSLLNERYQRGAEMLGSDVLSVRLGGIYALRSLAVERPIQYHIQAMQSLCAFVRNPTEYDPPPPGGEPELREDVQVALDAICDCHNINTKLDSVTEFWLDLRNADLRGARLKCVDLSVKPSPSAKIINSHQSGADFAHAKLHSAKMAYAKFPCANFTEAKLPDADLYRANLSGAELFKTDLYCAKLSSANLSDANLSSTNLLNADLHGANLSDANLFNADLSGATLRRVDLSGAILSNVQGLTQAQLDQTRPYSARSPNLEGAFDAKTGKQLKWCSSVPEDEQP